MTELEAAEQIRDGLLPSPWKHENITLFAVRVTGTGMAYRDSLGEYVWRSPEIFLSEDLRRRVAGLPLIWEHPEKGSLNSKEFNNRVIGSLMFGYVKGSELWGIARVYDDAAIALMTTEQLSTSPGVVFKESDGNTTIEVDDGKTLLIENKPATLCHLAVCERGVWDKGGPASGIINNVSPDVPTESSSKDLNTMSEETEAARKAREDAARHDAAEELSKKLDAVMQKLDSAHTRMDAMDKARRDAEEKERAERDREDRARRDAARKDFFAARKDGESEEDMKKRHDADEMAACDSYRKDGDDEKEAKEKAAKDRRDADVRRDAEETERKEREDKERKDAETEEERKALEKANEAKREDAARHDAALKAENASLRARLEAIEARFTREQSAEERDALAAAQARADSVACMFGERVGAPLAGESPLSYRRRLLQKFAKHSAAFKDGDFSRTDEATLGLLEGKVYADAEQAARAVSGNKVGILVPITTRENGRDVTRYTGDSLAWMMPYMSGSQSGKFIDPRKH